MQWDFDDGIRSPEVGGVSWDGGLHRGKPAFGKSDSGKTVYGQFSAIAGSLNEIRLGI